MVRRLRHIKEVETQYSDCLYNTSTEENKNISMQVLNAQWCNLNFERDCQLNSKIANKYQ